MFWDSVLRRCQRSVVIAFLNDLCGTRMTTSVRLCWLLDRLPFGDCQVFQVETSRQMASICLPTSAAFDCQNWAVKWNLGGTCGSRSARAKLVQLAHFEKQHWLLSKPEGLCLSLSAHPGCHEPGSYFAARVSSSLMGTGGLVVGSLEIWSGERSRRDTTVAIDACVLCRGHGWRSGGSIITAIVVLCVRMQAINS